MKHTIQTKNIKKLFKSLVHNNYSHNCISPEHPHLISKIPEQLQLSDDKEKKFIAIGGALYSDYLTIYKDLRLELSLEYLTDKELEDVLWYLFCEIYLNLDKYKSDEKINDKINTFISNINKPINKYEIFIGIKNLNEIINKMEIWDFSIFQLSRTEFSNMFGKARMYESDKERFIDSSIMSFTEYGNNHKLVCERAREKANFNIKILQLYLRNSNVLWDDQILLSASEYMIAKNTEKDSDIIFEFRRNRKPIKLERIDDFKELFDIAENHYLKLNALAPKMVDRIKRSINWIGESINEEKYDTKVMFLCIALETLLTTIDDKNKGGSIANRIILLNRELSMPFTNPIKIIFIYKLRSKVVHGSNISICNKSDYYTLMYEVKRILNNFICYAYDNNISKISQLISNLENKNNLRWLKSWLNQYDEAVVGDLLNAVYD